MTAVEKGANGKPLHHPALKLYMLTIVLLVAMIILGFIAVFVPWVMKDLAVGTRAWAYPFKTCFEDTFSLVNAESCMDNDFIEPTGAPLTGGNATCKAFILATIAFVFISVIGGVLTLLTLLLVVIQLTKRPVCLAAAAQIALLLVCITAFLSWIMFICYAEKTCAENSIFPVQGYSYGFICYIFASVCALGSVLTGFMGFSKLRAYRPEEEIENSTLVYSDPVVEEHGDCPQPRDPEAHYPQPTPYSASVNFGDEA